MPDPGQQVRLLGEDGMWREGFRAISGPLTAGNGEIVVWVAEEGEYRIAGLEGRSAVGILWPVDRLEIVVS